MMFLLVLTLSVQSLIASPEMPAAADQQGMVDEILKSVARLRDLRIRHNVPAVSHTKAKILAYVRSRIAEEYPKKSLETEGDMLKHLGLIPGQMDYRATLSEFVTAQVAGYFDPFKDRFVLASWLPELMQKPIIAHELVHALQHQHFGLKNALKRIAENDDATAARAAIIEGDATIGMMAYMVGAATPAALTPPIEAMAKKTSPGPTLTTRHIPYYMQRSLLFPYTGGLKLLLAHFNRAGFAGIDALHARYPESTEQLLHPEKYGVDHPVALDFKLPASDLGGYKVMLRNRLGEQGFRFLVSPLGKNEAQSVALSGGWGGDRLVFLMKGAKTALVGAVATDNADATIRYQEVLHRSLKHRYSTPGRGGAAGRQTSDGFILAWASAPRCLAWVEAGPGMKVDALLARALAGCVAALSK
jgi:hypothetical protein